MYLPTMPARLIATLSLAVTSALAAPAVSRPPVPASEPSRPPVRVAVSIPYPNAGVFMHRGIYGSFAGGRWKGQAADTATGDPVWQDPLYQWQGELGYFYTHWFSGGVGFRINAGSPNDELQTVKNRYFVMLRVHRSWPSAAVYLGARVGVDDVSFALLAKDDTTGLGGRLSESNAGVGLAFGSGWKFSRHLSATFGQRVDVSLVRQNPDNPHRTLEFLSQPGLALDLVKVFPSLGENLKAFYLFTEWQAGQTLSERGDWLRQSSWITGLSMGF